jgi:hypothetical protein
MESKSDNCSLQFTTSRRTSLTSVLILSPKVRPGHRTLVRATCPAHCNVTRRTNFLDPALLEQPIVTQLLNKFPVHCRVHKSRHWTLSCQSIQFSIILRCPFTCHMQIICDRHGLTPIFLSLWGSLLPQDTCLGSGGHAGDHLQKLQIWVRHFYEFFGTNGEGAVAVCSPTLSQDGSEKLIVTQPVNKFPVHCRVHESPPHRPVRS